MGTNNNPFLFFHILAIVLSFFITQYLHAQEPADSLDHYYNALLHPKKNKDLLNGIKFYSRLKEGYLKNKDTTKAIEAIRMIAIGQFKIGYKYESENSVVEALYLMDNLRHKDTLVDSHVGLYNQLGKIYRTSNNSEKAIEAYNKALEICKKRNDSVTILNNKANIYKDLGKYKLAEIQLSTIFDKNLEEKYSLQHALLLDNLGYVQSKINSPDALQNLTLALQIREDLNEVTGIHSSNKNLSNYYMDRDNKEMAIYHAKKAYDAVKHINSSLYTLDALSLLMSLSENSKVQEYKRLTDSISRAKQLAENKNAFAKYNIEVERKKTEATRLLQEKEKRKRLLYQALTIITLLVLLLSFFIFRYRYQKGKLEQVYKTETRISKKLHDELSNDTYNIMVQLENEKTDPTIINKVHNIYNRIRNFSKENYIINVGETYNEDLSKMISSYTPKSARVILNGIEDIDWGKISKIKKIAVYRVLQEFMTNMNKHSQATHVAIVFSESNKSLGVNYSDNGIGTRKDELSSKGGLLNVENRISVLGGSLIFDSQEANGFRAEVKIPI